jgi:hypothetical protein
MNLCVKKVLDSLQTFDEPIFPKARVSDFKIVGVFKCIPFYYKYQINLLDFLYGGLKKANMRTCEKTSKD